jgi:hypothetical protein
LVTGNVRIAMAGLQAANAPGKHIRDHNQNIASRGMTALIEKNLRDDD